MSESGPPNKQTNKQAMSHFSWMFETEKMVKWVMSYLHVSLSSVRRVFVCFQSRACSPCWIPSYLCSTCQFCPLQLLSDPFWFEMSSCQPQCSVFGMFCVFYGFHLKFIFSLFHMFCTLCMFIYLTHSVFYMFYLFWRCHFGSSVWVWEI